MAEVVFSAHLPKAVSGEKKNFKSLLSKISPWRARDLLSKSAGVWLNCTYLCHKSMKYMPNATGGHNKITDVILHS